MMNRYFWLLAALLLALTAACNGAAVPDPQATATHTPPAATPGAPVVTAEPTGAAEQPLTVPPPDYSPQLDALQSWLITAWAERSSPTAAQAALQAAGWQNDPSQFVTADLTGDGRDEWLVSICIAEDEDEAGCREMYLEYMVGDLWIIGAGGALYAYSDRNDISWQMAPEVLEIVDMTGDGRLDALIASTACGAHTCYQHYLVLSAHHGTLANVMNPGSAEDELAWGEGTSLSYSTYQLSAETPPSLTLHGGLVGSAGAGIHRGYTELWRWDGATVGYHEFTWDESNYRFHRLYDANQAWTDGDMTLAAVLYEEIISDSGLEDTEWWSGSVEEVRDAALQFAAFRLARLSLRQGDVASATAWQAWLQESYAGRPLQQAADLLLARTAVGDSLTTACTAVTNFLLTLEDPLGPLHDMGYANPALQAEDACPLD
jgi:hypothetical protein